MEELNTNMPDAKNIENKEDIGDGSPTNPPRKGSISPWGCGCASALLIPILLLFGPSMLEIPFKLIFGWMWFLDRAMDSLQWSTSGIASALLAISGCLICSHSLMRWVWVAVHSRSASHVPWRFSTTVQVFFAFVVLFASGIGAIGVLHQTAWIARSPEPMFVWNNGPRRAQSINNLKQLGLAHHNYHDQWNRFSSAGGFDERGRPRHGWGVTLLPYVDQGKLHDSIDLTKPWDDVRNRAPFLTKVQVYAIPGLDVVQNQEGYALSHYAGNSHLFPSTGKMTINDIKDGTSKTILMGEAIEGMLPWGHPWNLRDPSNGLYKGPASFGGPWTKNGTYFLMADGSVDSFDERIDPAILRAFATPAAGDKAVIPRDELTWR